jgi:hypothetical protein
MNASAALRVTEMFAVQTSLNHFIHQLLYGPVSAKSTPIPLFQEGAAKSLFVSPGPQ